MHALHVTGEEHNHGMPVAQMVDLTIDGGTPLGQEAGLTSSTYSRIPWKLA
jgi:hypothetical protein